MKNSLSLPALALSLAAFGGPALAQQAPDAGQALQQQTRPATVPTEPAVSLPQMPAPAEAAPVPPGGTTVAVRSVTISGNRIFSGATLSAELGFEPGKTYDLAGMEAMAARITAYYLRHGYPFTRAYVPAQDLSGGQLSLVVIEGRYGKITATGTPFRARGAERFLKAMLHHGDPIATPRLERAMLILDDQAGMQIRPVISPGAEIGEGDLTVRVERKERISGEAGADNFGNRYTGEYRGHVNLVAESALVYGDKLSLNNLYTNNDMWLGSVEYERPLGYSGLRGAVSFAHTNYQLGYEFASLDAVGYADVYTGKLTYPLVRSQQTNVYLGAAYEHKELEDNYRASATVRHKRSDAAVLTIQFDNRDGLGGGGITYGQLGLTFGRLHLDPDGLVADAQTARTAGNFAKVTLDLVRIQKLFGAWSAYGHFSGQWSGKNLDSAEQFGLGGYYGVRAYPLGEGMAARGWLVQTELRHAFGELTPFAFFDAGKSDINAHDWEPGTNATRDVGAAGLGLRFLHGGLSVEGTVAWSAWGGPAKADMRNRNPRGFFTVTQRF